ncbi:hypothetical protein CFter6_0772 [Collimonas fungivorans]|uniref:Uncharacterized protein n=1 Tax=Collimonas fungivorans TaxID=158899 RepID=A0A127P6U9_9BURK|nr:hypothetical protein CFter6_0772 [Collimonas fungivorans]
MHCTVEIKDVVGYDLVKYLSSRMRRHCLAKKTILLLMK